MLDADICASHGDKMTHEHQGVTEHRKRNTELSAAIQIGVLQRILSRVNSSLGLERQVNNRANQPGNGGSHTKAKK